MGLWDPLHSWPNEMAYKWGVILTIKKKKHTPGIDRFFFVVGGGAFFVGDFGAMAK